MSKLELTYQDTTTDKVENKTVFPDAGGTYKLPILEGHDKLKLRLMRVDATTSKLERVPFPLTSPGVQVLLIPATWKDCYLTVAYYKHNGGPKHLVFLIASEKKISTGEASKRVNARDGKTPILLLDIYLEAASFDMAADKVKNSEVAAEAMELA